MDHQSAECQETLAPIRRGFFFLISDELSAPWTRTVAYPFAAAEDTILSKSLFGDLSDEFEHRLMDISADI
jgi:hypothetical protein